MSLSQAHRTRGVGRLSVRSHPKRRLGGEAGQAAVSNLVTVLVVGAAVLVSWVLLYRTTSAANRINAKAARIAKVGQGINIATDSVIQLNRTNATASSILTTAKPLEGKLSEIIRLGTSINGLAASIDGTAKTINGTAGDIQGSAVAIDSTALKINGTAKGINSTAAAILDVAKRINDDVATINLRIDTALGIVSGVKGDTGNILGQAQTADRLAKCIDSRIGNPGAC